MAPCYRVPALAWALWARVPAPAWGGPWALLVAPWAGPVRANPDAFIAKSNKRLEERFVSDAARLVGLVAEAFAAVRKIVCVIAFEPHDLAFAFECEDVRSHTVEKPAIVPIDYGAPREVEQRLLPTALFPYNSERETLRKRVTTTSSFNGNPNREIESTRFLRVKLLGTPHAHGR